MSQLLTSDAISYSAWLGLESFTTQMLAYMTQMEGFLLNGEQHKLLDDKEAEKKKQEEDLQHLRSIKRKRGIEDVGGDERSYNMPMTMEDTTASIPALPTFQSPVMNHDTQIDVSDAEMDELQRGGPLDLPMFRTGFSSPVKQQDHSVFSKQADPSVDDSGIGLSLDDQADPDTLEAEKEAKHYNKRDWLLSSDPAEPGLTGLGVII